MSKRSYIVTIETTNPHDDLVDAELRAAISMRFTRFTMVNEAAEEVTDQPREDLYGPKDLPPIPEPIPVRHYCEVMDENCPYPACMDAEGNCTFDKKDDDEWGYS